MPKKVPKGRRFGEGQPTNRGGRPKGLMQAIRAESKDGLELKDFAFKLLRGEKIGTRIDPMVGPDQPIPVFPETKDRIEALKWLGDRGFGKPIQEIDMGEKAVLGVVILPPEDDG